MRPEHGRNCLVVLAENRRFFLDFGGADRAQKAEIRPLRTEKSLVKWGGGDGQGPRTATLPEADPGKRVVEELACLTSFSPAAWAPSTCAAFTARCIRPRPRDRGRAADGVP